MRHFRVLIASIYLLVFGVITNAFCQSTDNADQQAALRKSLSDRRQQLKQRQNDLKKEKSSLDADRKRIARLKRDLRAAQAEVARVQVGIRKWICNAWNNEHNSPSECSDPEQGGHWITKSNPDRPAAEDRVRDIESSLADAERQLDADRQSLNNKTAQFNTDARQLATDIDKAGFGKTPVLLSGDPASVRDFTQRAVDRAWTKTIDKAASNLKSDADLSAALTQAANGNQYLQATDLKAIVSIESTANRATGVNRFGYAGLFQMGKSAAKDVGYDFDDLNDPSDWKTNVEAGDKYLEKNAKRLAEKKLPVSALNVYLSHQQGPTGGARIIEMVQNGTAATTPANNNMLQNLPKGYRDSITRLGNQVTVQNFYDYWSDAFSKVNSTINQ